MFIDIHIQLLIFAKDALSHLKRKKRNRNKEKEEEKEKDKKAENEKENLLTGDCFHN